MIGLKYINMIPVRGAASLGLGTERSRRAKAAGGREALELEITTKGGRNENAEAVFWSARGIFASFGCIQCTVVRIWESINSWFYHNRISDRSGLNRRLSVEQFLRRDLTTDLIFLDG